MFEKTIDFHAVDLGVVVVASLLLLEIGRQAWSRRCGVAVLTRDRSAGFAETFVYRLASLIFLVGVPSFGVSI